MTNCTQYCAESSLPANLPDQNRSAAQSDSQAVTLKLERLPKGRKQCLMEGKLAFVLPWAAITSLGIFSAAGHPENALLAYAVIPGLLAGASGMLLYRASKKMVNYFRPVQANNGAAARANITAQTI